MLSSFSPSDHKLATCSDDGTVRIWDFTRCYEEKVLRGKSQLVIYQITLESSETKLPAQKLSF